jgi:2-polyprenyl-3-methyl-5-hydroxy-6-metoxy-1,4-benzoquinol methylase
MTEAAACPICRSDRTRFLFEGWDLQFGHPDSAFVHQCRECEHIFVAGELTPEQLTDMYTNYYPRSNLNVEDYTPYKEKSGLLYWLDGEEAHAYRYVPKNVRILDIGCGYCKTLGYHKARGCEVYGVEADENARKVAERYGFNVHIGLFDSTQYEPDSFDYITLDQVLEHIIEPLTFLKEVNKILKPGGKFIASFPNQKAFGRYFFGQYWTPWHLPYHRHFYSKRSLAILTEQAGYKIEKFKSATESLALLNTWERLFYIGKKGKKAHAVFQSLDNTSFDSGAKKRWDVKIHMFLMKIRFLRLPMRLADFFGRGDSTLLILQKKHANRYEN